MIATIETNRFLLREFRLTDVEALFAVDSDPEVVRYLGKKPLTTHAEVEEVIRMVRKQYEDFGIGRWMVENKLTGEVVGWCGLKWIEDNGEDRKNYYDVGYRLARKYWGQGIATECALASLDYAFNMIKAKEVFAAASIDNGASNRVLQKIGMQNIGRFFYDDIECNWYRIESPMK